MATATLKATQIHWGVISPSWGGGLRVGGDGQWSGKSWSGPGARERAAMIRDAGMSNACRLMWRRPLETGWREEPCTDFPELVDAWLTDDYQYYPF